MNPSLRKLLLFGVLAEIAIFLLANALYPSMEETIRHAARYSGRLSAFVFLAVFYLFATSYPAPVKTNTQLRNGITVFAVLHVIHFGLLATNVYLNSVPLEAPKLAGGAWAYCMIVAAPFYLHKVNFWLRLTYFYYTSLVMILTYVARIKGDFQGADPFWFHYAMMGILIGACAVLGGWLVHKSRKHAAG